MTIRIGRSKHTIIFIVLAFYLLFAPPLFGIHSMYFVAAFSWLYLLINYKSFFRYIDKEKLLKIYMVFIMMLIWVFLLVFFNDGTQSVLYHYIYWIIAIVPGALTLCVHAQKKGQGLYYVLRILLWAAFIQSLLSVAAFINNDFKLTLINMLQADDTLIMTTYTYEIYYRLFGFSAGLTFDMPSAMSMFTCIAMYLGINRDIKYMLFIPTIALSAIINARTSVVVIVIGLFVVLFMSGKLKGKTIFRLIIGIVTAIAVFTIGRAILSEISPMTYNWLNSGISQIFGFFQRNTNSGYFGYLTDGNRWILPTGLSLLFGTGSRIMGGSKYGVYSDVGYINDIWFGGFLYMLLLYIIVMKTIWMIGYKYSTLLNADFLKFISIMYLLCLPILNVKTFIISMGSFSTIIIICGIYAIAIRHSNTIIRE